MKIKLFRKIFCLFLIILLGINNYPVFSANSSWNALDNFTNRQYNLLFESNLSNVSSEYWDIFDMSRKVDVFNNLWESIKRSRESVEASNTAIIIKKENRRRNNRNNKKNSGYKFSFKSIKNRYWTKWEKNKSFEKSNRRKQKSTFSFTWLSL